VTNQQLYLAIGIPLLFNASLIGVLIALFNAKLGVLETKLGALETKMDAKFAAVTASLDAIDKRFDDMRDLWRAELHRVEEVLDARLKHLESQR
jgi:hypothetical protein